MRSKHIVLSLAILLAPIGCAAQDQQDVLAK
jgi:hypothetical protein